MTKKFKAKDAKDYPMTEGRTYLAHVVKCPWAYRKIKGHKSSVGRLVKVKLSTVVDIEWVGGDSNSVDRSHIRVIGELGVGEAKP